MILSSRFLWLFLSLIFCHGIYANEDVLPRGDQSAEKEITKQLAQSCYANEAKLAPAMVAIRPGRFQMGSPENEAERANREGPQHPVAITRPFAISRCEITVGQFRQFVQEANYQTVAEKNGKGCSVWNTATRQSEQQPDRNWKNPGFAQHDDHPVVCVSWHDVQQYVRWLSQRTGAQYRLPTEAEWEYAARAGTRTARFYDDNKQCDYANGAGREVQSIAGSDRIVADCQDAYVYTAPVASFAENPFGLFDMLGNAWEWTQDCWHDNYQNAPADSSAWLEAGGGDCTRRLVRGGSWYGSPQFLRSASRGIFNTEDADDDLGFRVARDF